MAAAMQTSDQNEQAHELDGEHRAADRAVPKLVFSPSTNTGMKPASSSTKSTPKFCGGLESQIATSSDITTASGSVRGKIENIPASTRVYIGPFHH